MLQYFKFVKSSDLLTKMECASYLRQLSLCFALLVVNAAADPVIGAKIAVGTSGLRAVVSYFYDKQTEVTLTTELIARPPKPRYLHPFLFHFFTLSKVQGITTATCRCR